MKRNAFFVLALVLTIAVPRLVNASGAEGGEGAQKVTLEFSGAQLSEVLGELAKQAGVDVVVEPEAEEVAGAVSVNLEGVRWFEAFDRILRVNCLVAERREGGEYVVRRAEVGLKDSEVGS